jgi:hypothetical protein
VCPSVHRTIAWHILGPPEYRLCPPTWRVVAMRSTFHYAQPSCRHWTQCEIYAFAYQFRDPLNNSCFGCLQTLLYSRPCRRKWLLRQSPWRWNGRRLPSQNSQHMYARARGAALSAIFASEVCRSARAACHCHESARVSTAVANISRS